MQNSNHIFDRRQYQKHRSTAAKHFSQYNFLKVNAAERIVDCLKDISRNFPLALDLGCHCGEIAQALKDSGKVSTLIQSDASFAMASRASSHCLQTLCFDEEVLPFAPHSFDLVVSALSLHHVNDLVGTLIQVRQTLKPDGLFLAILPGANTLRELREAFVIASIATEDGISPHVAPFVEVRDAGNLLQRAGFALPVIDSDSITITYESTLDLMKDLRGMGESNILNERRKGFTPKDVLLSMSLAYSDNFYDEEKDRINATCELLTLTAWAQGENQQQPAKRGSGKVNLGEIFQ